MHLLKAIGTFSLVAAAKLQSVRADDADTAAAVSLINQARQQKELQPLSWSPNLAAYAAYWANSIASGVQAFAHSSGSYRPDQGETLYEEDAGQCGSSYDSPLRTAVQAWLAEAPAYNGQPVATGTETWLHWSQCLWSQTTQIGCARAFSVSDPYQFYVVCRFVPEGNIIGDKPF